MTFTKNTMLGPELVLAVAVLLINVLIAMYPPLAQARDSLMVIVTALGALLISGQLAARFHNSAGVPFFKLPLFGPVWQLLSSRKFWVAFATIVADMIVAQVPEMKAVRSDLIQFISILGGIVIAGIAYEDGKKNGTTPPPAVSKEADTGNAQIGSTAGMADPGMPTELIGGPYNPQTIGEALPPKLADASAMADQVATLVYDRIGDKLAAAINMVLAAPRADRLSDEEFNRITNAVRRLAKHDAAMMIEAVTKVPDVRTAIEEQEAPKV
jgi:hypothetical protein